MDFEEYWDILSVLLITGQKGLAYRFYRVVMRAVRVYGLKLAECDVLLCADDPISGRPQKSFDEIIDQSWGVILMTYTYGQEGLSEKCFETEVKKILRKTNQLCLIKGTEPYAMIAKSNL